MENTFLKCGKTNLVGLGTLMVSRSITNYLNKGIKESGLTITQIYALLLVDKFRGEHMSYISAKGIMDRTTLTRALYSMREYASVHRDPNGDLRFVYPALTQKGGDFLEKWMPKVLELEEGLEIPAGDGEAFIRFVNFFSSELAYLNKKNKKKPADAPETPTSHLTPL